jgi:8-amino-7-oxononanoate synthase
MPFRAKHALPANYALALAEHLQQRAAQGLLRSLHHSTADNLLNFSDNDYLGLSRHPALAHAVNRILSSSPVGSGAARLVGADGPEHRRLEQALARFKGCQAALVFSSGYQANVGTVAALARPGDVIYSDQLNHASLIDGCRLSRATVQVYRHCDTAHLLQLLHHTQPGGRRLIVTDGVFGMDGDLAPLAALAALAREFDALLMVDDAHATGIYGPHGRGMAAACQVDVPVQVTTFGKSLGTLGAAVTGDRVLIDYLVNYARTFIYSTALPPALCAATSAAIEIVQGPEGDALRSRLRENVQTLVAGLNSLGLPVANTDSPIQPIHYPSPSAAVTASIALRNKGLFVQSIRPPTVPKGTSRLRVSVNANHHPEEIQRLLQQLEPLLPRPAARCQAADLP